MRHLLLAALAILAAPCVSLAGPPAGSAAPGLNANSPADSMTVAGRAQSVRAADVINVADAPYGAKCDGVTDDTAAFNAATAAVRAATGAYAHATSVTIQGPQSGSGRGCLILGSINVTGFTNFGNGSQLLLKDWHLLCSSTSAVPTNICLDEIDSLNVNTENLSIVGSASMPPYIGWQEGNSKPNAMACCIHVNHNPQTAGSFTFAARANDASETTTDYGAVIRSNGAAIGPIWSFGTIAPGSGYADGTYTSVALSGSATGTGAIATVVVSGGQVTAVDVRGDLGQPGVVQGYNYGVGDVLTAPASALGGSGSGFSVPVAGLAHYAYVLDGANHWGYQSAYQPISWGPAGGPSRDYYYTFSGQNLVNGSIRYTGSDYGSAVWAEDLAGAHFYHTYMYTTGRTSCIQLFDPGATNGPNGTDEFKLDYRCEAGAPAGSSAGTPEPATNSIYLYGARSVVPLSGFDFWTDYDVPSAAVIGTAPNITAVNARDVHIHLGHVANASVPLLSNPSVWNITGQVYVPSAPNWSAPSSFGGRTDIGGLVTYYGVSALSLPSSLSVSQIAPSGAVGSLTGLGNGYLYFLTSAAYPQFPTVSIAAPPSGGAQAVASVSGANAVGIAGAQIPGGATGSGYTSGDVGTAITMAGAVCATLPKLNITAVSGGQITGVSGNTQGSNCTQLPIEPISFTGGSGTGAVFTHIGWEPSFFNVSVPGNGYVAIPAASCSGEPNFQGTCTLTATLSNSLNLQGGGAGAVNLTSAGTQLGVGGTAGKPVTNLGASVDGSGVPPIALTSAGDPIPANTSLRRYKPTAAVTATVTLPTPVDGQALYIDNISAFGITLTFSPAVNGWTNGSVLAGPSGTRLRGDSATGQWDREQ
jgi:hypothetical protein